MVSRADKENKHVYMLVRTCVKVLCSELEAFQVFSFQQVYRTSAIVSVLGHLVIIRNPSHLVVSAEFLCLMCMWQFDYFI